MCTQGRASPVNMKFHQVSVGYLCLVISQEKEDKMTLVVTVLVFNLGGWPGTAHPHLNQILLTLTNTTRVPVALGEATFPARDGVWIFLLAHLRNAAGRGAFPKHLRPLSTKYTILPC